MSRSVTLKELGYKIVEIEVNNQCNMACSFCPLPIRESKDASLEIEQIGRILDQVAADGTVNLVAFHQFNEPLLYPHIWECLDMARDRGLETLLVTNGANLTPRNVDNLFAHPPTMLRISAQVIKEENHNATRGYKGKFVTYVTNLARTMARFLDQDSPVRSVQMDLAVQRHLRGVKERLAVMLGVADHGDPTIFEETPETLHDAIGEFLLMVQSFANDFRYDPAHHQAMLDKAATSNINSFDLAYQLSDKVSITYKQFVNGRRIRDYHPVDYGNCHNPNLGILADGRVVMCCFDYDGFTTMGNIKDAPLLDILERSRGVIDNIRRGGKLHCEGCRKCLGAPTKTGAAIRNVVNRVRFG